MFMDYTDFSKKPKQFLSLTSLEVEEFELLLQNFKPRWERYYRSRTLEGKHRIHPAKKEHGNAVLQGTEQKLFFLLVFLKNNSLQEHQAASFGISQPKVSCIARTLLSVLDQTLKGMGLSPCRDGETLHRLLVGHSDKVFSYDGTDRSIERNSDQDAQEVEFSGKNHGHKVKNLQLCDDKQFVHYLSPTFPGSSHDKAIANEYPISLPMGSVLRQDSGFIGHTPPGVTIEQPFKKPRNGELTFSQKLFNKMLATTRVVVEHANSGIKRLRMVKDVIRIHATEFRDMVMVVACALHNLRVLNPNRNYSSHAHASA
jgi:DDE superfamily endonuclease/Helix-turn-helix of DDE superfamily endonuclease